MPPLKSPPRPTLTLRLGVTGHRPGKLDQAAAQMIAPQLDSFLRQLTDAVAAVKREHTAAFADSAPTLRLLSSLAEGADRLVAAAALRQNYELVAMLPFARDVYAADFVDEASRREFDALIEHAATIVELDGRYDPPAQRDAAYLAAGLNVVSHSDALIALWDGRPAGGRGGTAEIIAEALRTKCPVVWFPTGDESEHHDKSPRLLPERSIAAPLAMELARLAAPPENTPPGDWRRLLEATGSGPPAPLARYFSERLPGRETGNLFGYFQKAVIAVHRTSQEMAEHIFHLVGFRAGAASHTPAAPSAPRLPDGTASEPPQKPGVYPAPDAISGSVERWNEDLAKVASAQGFHDKGFDRLATHYAWLDGLAIDYTGLYRSAYLANYLLAAFAIMAAATFTKWGSGAELFFIFFILAITLWGNARRWHLRWIEYRDIAERLRTLRFLRLVASPPAVPEFPKHLREPVAPAPWTQWLYQAIVRECGLPGMRFEPDYLARVRAHLAETEIEGQVRYHRNNSGSLHRFDNALHVISATAFVLTFVVALAHIWFPHEHASLLTYLSIILPTLGAAMFAIRNQGEFVRMSERSERMTAVLKTLRDELTPAAGVFADRQALKAKAQEIATTMLSETSDWKIVFRARRLELPG